MRSPPKRSATAARSCRGPRAQCTRPTEKLRLSRQQREEVLSAEAQRLPEQRAAAHQHGEPERHGDHPQRDIDDEAHAPLRSLMWRQAMRAARPARIGSGIEKMTRHITKSAPKNGS